MDSTLTAALIAGVPSIAAAVFTYRASVTATRAKASADSEVNRLAATKVDAEAYERSQAIYEKAMASAEKEVTRLQGQVDRLQAQLERVNDQLAREQDVSNTLRNHVRTLQTQVQQMEQTVTSLRTSFSPGAHPPGSGQQQAR